MLRLGLVAVLTIVRGLQLRGWEIGGGAVQPPVVEPVDVLEGGDLDLLDRAPRTPPLDQLSREQSDRRLGQGVVLAVATQDVFYGVST